MQALISYVIQDAKEHVHQSEIIEFIGPPWHCTPVVPISDVMEWLAKRQSELPEGQKLVLISAYLL